MRSLTSDAEWNLRSALTDTSSAPVCRSITSAPTVADFCTPRTAPVTSTGLLGAGDGFTADGLTAATDDSTGAAPGVPTSTGTGADTTPIGAGEHPASRMSTRNGSRRMP
ncbi:hypothetical protein [Actinokineospora sp.]|uniref:hypothetical protein n=1 Tax=Actinokineospora sp. TaxID=1872133 RepID=UPI003D6BADAB